MVFSLTKTIQLLGVPPISGKPHIVTIHLELVLVELVQAMDPLVHVQGWRSAFIGFHRIAFSVLTIVLTIRVLLHLWVPMDFPPRHSEWEMEPLSLRSKCLKAFQQTWHHGGRSPTQKLLSGKVPMLLGKMGDLTGESGDLLGISKDLSIKNHMDESTNSWI